MISQDGLEKIAAQDKKELVKSVQEYFADYVAIDKYIFTLNIPSITPLFHNAWDHPAKDR